MRSTLLGTFLLLLIACSGASDSSRSTQPAQASEGELIAAARERRMGQITAETGPAALAGEYARAREAIRLVQLGQFADAERASLEALAADEDNPYLHLVAGLADVSQGFIPLWKHYERFELVFDLLEVALEHPELARAAVQLGGGDAEGVADINFAQLAESAARIRRGFAEADAHLARAESHADIQLVLCPAAWLVDWNDDGVLDGGDAMWEVGVSEDGQRIARDDYEARMPVFRYDLGDIAWLRAMIAFQGAIADVLRAYDWGALRALIEGADEVEIRLVDAAALESARAGILAGLGHSERSRLAYLAETDDQQEWLSNPRQLSGSFPATLGEAGFEAWSTTLVDLRRIVEGEAVLPITPFVYVLSESPWEASEPKGLRVDRLFSQPQNLLLRRVDLLELRHRRVANLVTVLSVAFGSEAVVDTSDDAGIFAPWVAAIDELDSERVRDRSGIVTSRYLTRRRVLYVN